MSFQGRYDISEWQLKMKKKMQSPQEAYAYRNEPEEYFEWSQDLREDNKTYKYVLSKMLLYPQMEEWLIENHSDQYLRIIK